MKNEFKKMANLLRQASEKESASDKKEMRYLASLIEEGKLKEAHNYFWDMDTFVREGIPNAVYTYLCVNRTGSKKRKIVKIKVKLKGCKKCIGHKEGFGPGEIYKCEVEFPEDATNDEIARSIVGLESKLIKDIIEVEYSEPETV